MRGRARERVKTWTAMQLTVKVKSGAKAVVSSRGVATGAGVLSPRA
jgi:hypothetical protein